MLQKTIITRYDDETLENLINEIKKFPLLSEVYLKSLDKRKTIYYD